MSVAQLLQRRRVPQVPPMAIPLSPDARKPLGVRFADWLHGIVTRRLSVASQRVLSWTLIALGVGAIGVAYLVQTSYVASLANESARLESTTTAVQDANARLTASVAEARAIGKAEPAARAQGLRVAGATAVVYLTAPDVPTNTPVATAVPLAAPDVRARVSAALVGRVSVDAPTPAPVGAAATAEATMRPASLGGIAPVAATAAATAIRPSKTSTGGTP